MTTFAERTEGRLSSSIRIGGWLALRVLAYGNTSSFGKTLRL